VNFSRILAIALNVFWEVMRERVLYLIALFALFLVGSVRLLREFALGTEYKIITDLGIAGIGMLGLVVAIFVGTGLINKEIEKRTVLVLLAKPISRADLIVGKYLGLSGVLAVVIFFTSLIYLGFLSLNQVSYPLGSMVVAIFFIFLELSLLTAVAIAFGVFTSSLLATLLTVGVYIMGHLSPDIIKAGELSENPALESFTKNLYLILPDLTRLDFKNTAVYGILPELSTLLFNAVYAVIYIVLLLAIANLIFRQKEF
jgi:ABC-type transport system involved in multi-copper enzyme maturation permease subunit